MLYFFAIFPICLAYCVGITNTFESFIYHQFLPLLNSEGVFADIIRAMYEVSTDDKEKVVASLFPFIVCF